MANEIPIPVTHDGRLEQDPGERLSPPRPRISSTEVSLRVKGILADRTGTPVQYLENGLPLSDAGTVRSVQYALDVIEDSFSIRLEERRSFAWLASVTIGELSSLVEGAVA